jgi:hypothetical protein
MGFSLNWGWALRLPEAPGLPRRGFIFHICLLAVGVPDSTKAANKLIIYMFLNDFCSSTCGTNLSGARYPTPKTLWKPVESPSTDRGKSPKMTPTRNP